MTTKLNAHEKSAMKRVGDGADVYDPALARTLRQFGAKLTRKGMEAIGQ